MYSGIYEFIGEDLHILEAQAPVPVEDMVKRLNELGQEVIFLGDGVPVYREKIEELITVSHRYAPAHMNKQRAGAVAVLAEKYFREGKTETAAEHQPVYLRMSQAEQEREKKKPARTKASGNRRMKKKMPGEAARIEAELFTSPGARKALKKRRTPRTPCMYRQWQTVRWQGIVDCGNLLKMGKSPMLQWINPSKILESVENFWNFS